VAAVLLSIAIFGVTIPQLQTLFPAAQILRYMRATECAAGLVSTGYYEPSLVFLAGTASRQTDGPGAADFLLGGACRFAVVEKGQERAFVQRAENIGLRYTRGLRFEGINAGGGRRVSITVFRS
jgi:hypothetical protein